MRIVYFILCFFILLPSTALSQRKYLFKWDEGSGHNMPGWTWSDDVAYGHPGWTLDNDGPFGGGKTYAWGYGPRSFEMGGATKGALALIDPENRGPSTSYGGSLKIFDDDTDGHFPSWWVWYDGEPLSNKSITTSETNRWSFYIKATGVKGNSETAEGAVVHIGTYLCGYTGLPTYGSGDGCPYEGPGNQHFYHYLYISPGAWLHVELDNHPTHLRDSFVGGNDPAFFYPQNDSDGNPFPMHYMEHINQWYIHILGDTEPVAFWLDDMFFYSTNDPQESSEANQNDASITSVWVGYWPETGKWQIGWQDMSYIDESGNHLGDNTQSTFEIRWSTQPITNSNYHEAAIIPPEWFSSPDATSYPHGLRRQSSWSARVWTQFDLPSGIEDANDKIYFAIKDVSVAGGNTGSISPYNRGDGHDAPTSNIKTIDYYLRPDGSSPTCDASHLSLCNDSTSCQGAGGNWCGGVCKSTPCVTAFNCGSVPLMQVH